MLALMPAILYDTISSKHQVQGMRMKPSHERWAGKLKTTSALQRSLSRGEEESRKAEAGLRFGLSPSYYTYASTFAGFLERLIDDRS